MDSLPLGVLNFDGVTFSGISPPRAKHLPKGGRAANKSKNKGFFKEWKGARQ
jgi:hypothetical protein